MKKKIALCCALFMLMSSTVFAAGSKYDGGDIDTLIKFIDYYYAGDEVKKEELYEAAIRAVFDKLDKYSVFYTPEEYADFIESVSGKFAGIGAYIDEVEGGVKIVEPIRNSPAEKAGLVAGDVVIAVDGLKLSDVSYDEGVDSIKGEPGTEVTLTIKRGVKVFDVTVIRDIIQVNAVTATPLLDLYPEETNVDAKDVWYVDIDSFNYTVAADFAEVVDQAKEANVKGMIIDLRNNSGGYLDQVVEMCQAMVPEGNILSTRDNLGNLKVYFSDERRSPFKLVVLTNEMTASASEIFASAIQDANVGVLVGESTYGKGVVQRIIKLEDNLQFKMTMSEYFTRDGNKINGIGVQPDVEIIIPDYLEDTNKTYLFESDDPMVKNIKEILNYLGYLEKEEEEVLSTVYDEKTVTAVMKFQETNNMMATGMCDYFTMGKLNERLYEEVKTFDPQMDMAMKIIYGMIY